MSQTHNPAVHRTLRDKAAQRPVTSTLDAQRKVMSKDNKSEKLDIVAAFVHELMNIRGTDSALHICISNFSVFGFQSSNVKRVRGFDVTV